DPAKQNKKLNVPVYCINRINEIIETYRVTTAILAVPSSEAQTVCNNLINKGIKGILNFAPNILQVPEDVEVHNIHITNELESLVYFIGL
ncbi:MAG: redox-sensing transcriptional repressor Rex, partial [Bacteroidetes bacterium]|nr:redox-sensing transcriptional repressor Rex [Bacteroidota bacterium]